MASASYATENRPVVLTLSAKEAQLIFRLFGRISGPYSPPFDKDALKIRADIADPIEIRAVTDNVYAALRSIGIRD